jgi:hypothetical protein
MHAAAHQISISVVLFPPSVMSLSISDRRKLKVTNITRIIVGRNTKLNVNLLNHSAGNTHTRTHTQARERGYIDKIIPYGNEQKTRDKMKPPDTAH